MAGNSLIGALRVSLGLDSAQFAKGAKGASKQADTMSSSIVKSLKGVTVAFAAVGAAATAMAAAVAVPVMRSIKSMDELAKSAQKVGTSAQDLQKLRYAADLSGVSSEKLTAGLTRLNVALDKVGKDGGTSASKALERLGVKSGTMTLDAMKKLAAEFQSMPDGVRKSALAVEIFGRAGADLIPLLNSGADGIDKMASEAERFGIVVDTKTLKAAELFNDNLTRLKRATEGVVTQFTAGLLPTLASVTDAMLANVATGPRWAEFGKSVGRGLVNVAEAAFVVYEAISGVTGAVISLVSAAKALASGQGFGAAGRIIASQEAATAAGIERRRKLFADLRKSIAEFQPGELAGGPGGGGDAGFMAGPLKAAREIKDIYNGLTASQVRMGGLERLQDVMGRNGGVSSGMKDMLETIKGMGDTMANVVLPSFEGLKQTIPQIKDPMLGLFQTATQFGETLARSLGQALVYGQSLGGALVSSIRAAAAELVTSGLLDLFLGQRSAGGGARSGGLFGSIVGALFGSGAFANGTKSAPGGLAMVGERGRELVGLPRGARVWSNRETENMLASQGKSGNYDSRPIAISFNVNTPDANSFRMSQNQIVSDLNRALLRSQRNQ